MHHVVYKVRLKNKSAERGKRGGFRVIYYVWLQDRVVLLTVYSKTDKELVSNEEIEALIADIETDDNTHDE